MSIPVIFGIAVGLAMDAFAVALTASIALPQVSSRQVFRFSFHFGLFQATMPIIGWTLGTFVAEYIRVWEHWIAFVLLAFVGLKAIHAALAPSENPARLPSDPTRGMSLIMFSVATSIDALVVGPSFAVIEVLVWYPPVIIGVTTAALTVAGMLLGAKLGARMGRHVEVLGGLILIGIGLKILIQHRWFP